MSWSSETNTIKEGSESKSLTLQMLEVKKQGGGTELFVRKSDVALGTKSVTQNGTYTAASDGKYGFSQFSVNVRGGSGSADSHGKPTGTIAPGGAGSAVVGTDPETGNEVVIGVDEDDNLVNTPLPSSIVLVTNPTKMDYNNGESIDLSGAVVVAKKADGSTWTDVDHPNGHVSCTPEPAAAAGSGTGEVWSADSSYIVDTAGTWLATVGDRVFNKANNGKAIAVFSSGSISDWNGPILISTDKEAADTNLAEFGFSVFEYGGLTWYVNHGYHLQGAAYSTSLRLVAQKFADYEALFNYIMQVANVQTGSGKQTITLNWARPGDGKVLSTTMEINVGAHTTESSSGTSGS